MNVLLDQEGGHAESAAKRRTRPQEEPLRRLVDAAPGIDAVAAAGALEAYVAAYVPGLSVRIAGVLPTHRDNSGLDEAPFVMSGAEMMGVAPGGMT